MQGWCPEAGAEKGVNVTCSLYFLFLEQKTAYEMLRSLVGSEMCIRDRLDTIEFKRHIAFGIPSMYGSYKERKFDTLKVFFLSLIHI